jgi:hypothetical protein
MASVATPLVFKVPWPIVVAPSENVTTPPGTVADPFGPVTVAVRVTEAAATAGFALDVSTVVVACFTLWLSAGEVAAPFWLSPPYTAVMLCDPVASVAVENAPTPVAFKLAAPISTVPSKKFTVPVAATGSEFSTTAVNVIAEPSDAGFALDVSVTCVGCTESTCPATFTTLGLFVAFVVADNDPVTNIPVTVGANSTPSTQVRSTATGCVVTHVVLPESRAELLLRLNALKLSAALPSSSIVACCGAEIRPTRITGKFNVARFERTTRIS